MQPPGKLTKKVCTFGLGHMTKMAAMPIYAKNLSFLLQNHWADCLETWDVASGISTMKFV